MWKLEEVKEMDLQVDEGVLVGSVLLETDDGSRGYQASLRGQLKIIDGGVSVFELVALGEFLLNENG